MNALNRRPLFVTVLAFVLTLSAAPRLVAQDDLVSQRIQVPVAPTCRVLTTLFQGAVAGQSGVERVHAPLQLTSRFIAKLQAGELREYFALNDLGLDTAMAEEKRLLSLATLMQAVLQSPAPYLLAFSVADLKYLPYIALHSHILLIIDNADELTDVRARMVAAAARQRKIAISVIWRGADSHHVMSSVDASASMEPVSKTTDTLRYLEGVITLSGGRFLDLSALARQCAQSI